MADLGATMLLVANPLASANATDGYEGIGQNATFTSDSFMITFMNPPFDIITDFENTVLFPASAYDSLVEPAIRFYKLRGYYVAGSMFETWVTKDPDAAPPSGHTLTNISIVDTWVV